MGVRVQRAVVVAKVEFIAHCPGPGACVGVRVCDGGTASCSTRTHPTLLGLTGVHNNGVCSDVGQSVVCEHLGEDGSRGPLRERRDFISDSRTYRATLTFSSLCIVSTLPWDFTESLNSWLDIQSVISVYTLWSQFDVYT